MHDLLKPAGRLPKKRQSTLNLARILTLVLGVFATGLAFYVSTLGQIIKSFFTFMSLFNGPVLALFLLGFFTVRGKFVPWLIAAGITIPATFWFQNSVKAHWVWFLPFATLLCLSISYTLSLFFKEKRDVSKLTVWTR
jgi:ABC-type polysaccharide/polyol phosphate export permease